MEPQLFSCGLCFGFVSVITTSPSFNGAATFQLRIGDLFKAHGTYQYASMEPQLFSCGLKLTNKSFQAHIQRASMEPQLFSCGLWEIAIENATTYSFNGAATFQLRIATAANLTTGAFIASMEPQLFSCGLMDIAVNEGILKKASMEPQLFSCGLQPMQVTRS